MAENQERKRERGWLGWVQIAIIVAIVIAAIVLTALLSGGEEAEGRGEPGEAGVPVEIVTPETATHQVRIETTGTVEAKAFVTLTPQVGGRVVSVADAVRAGGRFGAGEVLFQIDPRDYRVAVERAQSAVADAQSALLEIRTEADIAAAEWRDTYPDREINPLAARIPQVKAAEARLQSARSDLAQARLNLERTTVSYPFEGRVTESRIEVGQLLAAGQSYGTVYSIGDLELVAPAAPADIARLDGAVGRPARIVLEGGETPLQGSVDREGARLDARSRLIDLYLSVDRARELRPGLFADVTIEGPRLDRVLTLPARAVAGMDGVYIVRGGTIEFTRVEIIDRPPGEIIVSPFDYGEGVIVTPVPEGALGREAQIVEETRPASPPSAVNRSEDDSGSGSSAGGRP